MFDRVGRLAEQTAVSLARRKFLIRMGRGALSVAALLGTTGVATAARNRRDCILNGGCCDPGTYFRPFGGGVGGGTCFTDKTCKDAFAICSGGRG
jgi:hypothetical protein